jgi:hypothetical protein
VFSRAKVFFGVDSKQDLIQRSEQYRQCALENSRGHYVQDPTEIDKKLIDLDELGSF